MMHFPPASLEASPEVVGHGALECDITPYDNSREQGPHLVSCSYDNYTKQNIPVQSLSAGCWFKRSELLLHINYLCSSKICLWIIIQGRPHPTKWIAI